MVEDFGSPIVINSGSPICPDFLLSVYGMVGKPRLFNCRLPDGFDTMDDRELMDDILCAHQFKVSHPGFCTWF